MTQQENFVAWLAGFIDGDGSIGLSASVRKRSVQFLPKLAASQHAACVFVLHDIQRALGYGAVYTSKTNKAAFQVTNKADARKLVVELQPYLIEKAPQAAMLLRALDILDTSASRAARDGRVRNRGDCWLSAQDAADLAGICLDANLKRSGDGTRYGGGRTKSSLMAAVSGRYGTATATDVAAAPTCNAVTAQWLAGFYDAEGCSTVTVAVRNKRGRTSINFSTRVSITQHKRDRWLLERIVAFLGFGQIYGRGKLALTFTNREEQRRFFAVVRPHLVVKAHVVDEYLRALDLLDTCGRGGVKFQRGDHAVPREIAEQLCRISVALNPKKTGGRHAGGRRWLSC